MEEENVPPLEDMTETFSSILKLREQKKSNLPTPNEFLEVSDDADRLNSKVIEKLLNKGAADLKDKIIEEKPNATETNNPSTYCGFKKGFLCPQNRQKRNTAEKKKEEITSVTMKNNPDKNVLPEVQEAIIPDFSFPKSKEWLNDDLLAKISSHPTLSKQFLDPRFSEAIAQFQSNPQKVMAMCQKDKALREFVQEFCGIMGEHFTELGEKDNLVQDDRTLLKSKNPNKMQEKKSNEEEKLKALISDPEISDILQKEEIQVFFKYLKEDQTKARRMFRDADSSLRPKIQKLIDVGLLQLS